MSVRQRQAIKGEIPNPKTFGGFARGGGARGEGVGLITFLHVTKTYTRAAYGLRQRYGEGCAVAAWAGRQEIVEMQA